MTSQNADDPRSFEGSETGRLEAFSDGVFAVIITIMALELKAPIGGGFSDLRARLPAHRRVELASGPSRRERLSFNKRTVHH